MIEKAILEFETGIELKDMQQKALETATKLKCPVHFYVDKLHWVVFQSGKCWSFIMPELTEQAIKRNDGEVPAGKEQITT